MTSTTNSDFDKSTEATQVAAAFPQSIKGRTILITGVNKQGIGFATAVAFASQSPARLIVAGRSAAKVKECVESLQSDYPAVGVRQLLVDLSSQASVRKAADEVLGWDDVPTIDFIINNAGIMRHGETYNGDIPVTEDGLEDQFGTNHIGHFLLTTLIMPKVLAAAKNASPGSVRVINLSSSGTYVSPFRASDIAWKTPASQLPEHERPGFAMMKHAGMEVNEDMAYFPTAAYGQSKTCNVLFSVGLNERLFEKYGILSLALNPGEVQTELSRNTDREWLDRMVKRRAENGMLFWKTTQQGASTTMVAACDPKLTLPESDGKGQYLNDCQIAPAPGWAVDKAAAGKLWSMSEELTGQTFSA